ncbi:MAG: hypothetical protein AAGK97_08385, partial [Bacteroidota bacterium]
MKKLLILLLLCPIYSFAQNVGINEDGSPPNPGAILDIKSSSKGILIPRLETSAVTSPVEGMLLFQPSDKQFYYYRNTSWVLVGSGPNGSGEFTSNGDLIFNAGNLDVQDLLFGRDERPTSNDISDKFLYYEQNNGSFRGGEVANSAVWAPGKLGEN